MKDQKQSERWWTSALLALCFGVLGAGWIPCHLGDLDGLDIMLALVYLANAVAWTVRTVRVFRRHRFDKK